MIRFCPWFDYSTHVGAWVTTPTMASFVHEHQLHHPPTHTHCPKKLKLYRNKSKYTYNKQRDLELFELSWDLAKAAQSIHEGLEEYHEDMFTIERVQLDDLCARMIDLAGAVTYLLRPKVTVTTSVQTEAPTTQSKSIQTQPTTKTNTSVTTQTETHTTQKQMRSTSAQTTPLKQQQSNQTSTPPKQTKTPSPNLLPTPLTK